MHGILDIPHILGIQNILHILHIQDIVDIEDTPEPSALSVLEGASTCCHQRDPWYTGSYV